MTDYKSFYDERRPRTYGDEYTTKHAEDHVWFSDLKAFVDRFELQGKRCLEIGSSGGGFQDLVTDYHGTDVSEGLAVHYHKDYRVAQGSRYPFDDDSFDAIWTVDVYEHIPDLQAALLEIKRMLKPGGVVFFAPAWQCRTWAADGYPVRPYADFDLRGKLIKALIPLRDSVAWRAIFMVPKRLVRHAAFLLGRRYQHIRYRRIRANYDIFWMSDSDACNHIDPHDAILWFESNGFQCLSHPLHLRALTMRTGALILRKAER